MAAATIKKSLSWGTSDSHVKFEVKGYVLGDGQVTKDWRHEYRTFGEKGDVPLLPIGNGTVNFQITADYQLVRQVGGKTVDKYTGRFGYRYWIDYSFDEGDKDPSTLDYKDLTLRNFQSLQLHETKPKLYKMLPIDKYEISTSGYPPSFIIAPMFVIETVSSSSGFDVGVGHSKSKNPPTDPESFGSIRLDLHVMRLTFPSLKAPKVARKVASQAVLLTALPFGSAESDLSANAQQIALAWKKRLFETYPELQYAIRDKVVRVYFDGYASEPGSDAYNLRLSENRAKKAAKFLAVPLGLKLEDLSYQSFGEEGAKGDKSKWKTDQIVFVYLRAADVNKVLNDKASR